MRKIALLIYSLLIINILLGQQPNLTQSQTKIMTLGVFHFAYPNLDAVKTDDKDKISVLDEPFQSEIKSICKAIEEFNPTIITVELTGERQPVIDSLYMLYKAGKFELKRSEIHQLGFRLGKDLNLDKIYCVDDGGRHYDNIEALFRDSTRLSKFEDYFVNSRDANHNRYGAQTKISSVIDALYDYNRPEKIKERLALYLLHPFKYEEEPGDFTGVDFETGRWYNRNLRIFRNIQRVPHNSEDRILLIIGSEHLNLLNLFFETSLEFELISPLPYLLNLKKQKL
jgi:hypothetical protein